MIYSEGDIDMLKIKLNKPEDNEIFNKKGMIQKVLINVMIIMLILNNPFYGNTKIAKAATQLNVTVDYTDETATVQTGSGQSTKFYMSFDNQKTWEQIDAGKQDISAMLSSREVPIYFKGNRDADPYKLVLQAEVNNLKPVYKVTAGVGRIEFTSSSQVQYRKGNNGTWINVSSPVSTAMYEIRGATLYFRTAPTATTRAGRIVNMRIPKRPTAPSIKLDGSKLNISGLKAGVTQYRVGDNTIWTTFVSTTNARFMDLAALLGGNTSMNTAVPAGIIEFRTPGDDKKVNSSVRVIEVSQQAAIVSSMVNVTGSTVTINDADAKKQYEYTVVKQGYKLDMSSAKWSTVTSARSVIVPRVSIGDKVLVRVKSTIDKSTNQVILASTYLEFIITGITMTKN